jgi:hypothetical protein
MNARADDAVIVTAFVAVDPALAFEVFTHDVDTWWRRGPQYRPGRGRDGTMRLEGRVGIGGWWADLLLTLRGVATAKR